ncbi:MAG TPA: dihydrofolate reductase [Candidatus Paceibacterota bacterium]|nr:dihydrofolate reductase [Candidatus Paceibacterota bacterium]
MISAVAAISAKDRGLGVKGDLLWKIPEDLKRFRDITRGHPVVMGRKTWESLPENVRPLPGRVNFVVTRDAQYEAKGATVVTNIDTALEAARLAPGGEEVFVIGGGEIYTAALPHTDRLYLTLIASEKPADAFFPEYEKEFTKEVFREDHETSEGLTYSWVDFER